MAGFWIPRQNGIERKTIIGTAPLRGSSKSDRFTFSVPDSLFAFWIDFFKIKDYNLVCMSYLRSGFKLETRIRILSVL